MINRLSALWLRRVPEVSGLFLLAAAANGAVFWDETLQGDLSNNQNAPSSNPLVSPWTAGTYTVQGTVNASGDFQDWLTFTVQSGFQLSAITLGAYASAEDIAFTGFGSGSTFPGNSGVAGSYVGYTHFGTAAGGPTVGSDLLAAMDAGSAGAQGFTAPLGAGNYTFVIQVADAIPTAYRFDYQVTAVPEPSSAAAIGGLLCAGYFLRRRWMKAREAAHSPSVS